MDGWQCAEDGEPRSNEFTLLAITTGTDVSPSFETAFSSDSVLKLSDQFSAIVASSTYDDLTNGSIDTSHVYVAQKTMDLWVSIKMPTDVTMSLEQTITLSVRATTPD